MQAVSTVKRLPDRRTGAFCDSLYNAFSQRLKIIFNRFIKKRSDIYKNIYL